MANFVHRLELLEDQEIEMISDAAFTILERTGFKFPHPRILDTLKKLGARIDSKSQVAKFDRGLVKECIDRIPKAYKPETLDKEKTIGIKQDTLKTLMWLGFWAVDYEHIQRRRGVKEDMLKALTVGNALEHVDPVSLGVIPSGDTPVEIADIVGHQLAFTYCSKPCYSFVFTSKSAGYIQELCEIISEERTKKETLGCWAQPISPLQFSTDTLEMMLLASESGGKITVEPMGMAGGNTPVTLAGAVALGVAEFLASALLIHALRPEQYLEVHGGTHVMDMRTCLYTYGAPENVLMDLCTLQVMKFRFGFACSCFTGVSDSNYPDIQAGFEKALSAGLVLAAGMDGLKGIGVVGPDQGCSLTQLVIDNEWLGELSRVFRGVEVNQETLALEIIDKVGPGGSFLEEDHTLKHMRKELWFPELFNRDSWDVWVKREDRDLIVRAKRKVEEILKDNYPPEPVISRSTQKSLEEVVEKARKELCKG